MGEFVLLAKKEIPSLDKIIDEAWIQLGLKKSFIKNNFSQALIIFEEKANDIYREYEKRALIRLAKLWLNSQKEEIRKEFEKIVKVKGWEEFVGEASRIFMEFGVLVQNLEKDLGNMRKARGGKSFEKIILKLLKFIDIECEFPKGKMSEELGRIDIVIPSIDVAHKTPDKAVFLTCKRTLRERWKQEVPQVRPNWRVYLLTIDNEITQNKAKEINKKGLIAFIKDELKEKFFKEMPWIRRLSDLPKEVERI